MLELFLMDVFGDLQYQVWLVSPCWSLFPPVLFFCIMLCVLLWAALALQKCIIQAETLPPCSLSKKAHRWMGVRGMGKILVGLMNSFGLERIDGSCVSWFMTPSPSLSAVTRHIAASLVTVSVFVQQIYVFSESNAFKLSETTEIMNVICVF